MELNFDPNRAPFPPYTFTLAWNKVEGVGMNSLGPRVFKGNTFHRGLTGAQTFSGAVGYLIAPSTRGLTDGYIDRNTGELVMMNPMRALFPNAPAAWKDKAGWANGPYGGNPFDINNVSADGQAWVRAFGRMGADTINQDQESFEITGNYDYAISDKAKDTIARICANRAQILKIPHDQWPVIPGSNGASALMGHVEWCGKAHKICPGPVVWDYMNGELVTRVRAILKEAQMGTTPVPEPKPDPKPDPTPKPDAPLPPGMSNELYARLFGTVKGYKFDANGIVSRKWIEYGLSTNLWPEINDVIEKEDQRWFVFEGGLVIWYDKKERFVRLLGDPA